MIKNDIGDWRYSIEDLSNDTVLITFISLQIVIRSKYDHPRFREIVLERSK